MKRFLTAICLLFFLPCLLWGANVTTLGDLRQDVENNFLVMTDTLFPDSVLDDFINQACRDLAGYNVIIDVDTITWVASTKNYDLPENFIAFVAIYPDTIAGGKAYDFIHPSAVGKIAAATDLTSPRYIWITGKIHSKDTTGMIWFYPAPSAVDKLELIYAAEAEELSAAGDTTNIPYLFRPEIVNYATALCYTKAQEYQKATYYYSLYQQMLDRKLLFQRQRYDYILIPREIKK